MPRPPHRRRPRDRHGIIAHLRPLFPALVLLLPLAAVLREGATLAERRRTIALLVAAAVAAPWSLHALALARGREEWSALTPIAFFLLLVGVHAWARR